MPASPTTALTINELRTAVGRYNGYGRTYASLNSDQKADIDDVVLRGLRRFYTPEMTGLDKRPHRWSFLMPATDIVVNANASWTHGSGGVTFAYNKSTSVLTITGDTFPSWANKSLVRFGGRQRRATATGGTTVTLAPVPDPDGAYTFASGDSVVVHHIAVPFPTSVVGFAGSRFRVDGPTYDHWATVASHHQIETEMTWNATLRSVGWVEKVGLRPASTTVGTESQLVEALLWPPPVYAQVIRARVQIAPDSGIDAGGTGVPLGGALHGETILAAVLATAEEYWGARDSKHRETYAQRLVASIELDRMNEGTRLVGYNGDGTGDDEHRWRLQTFTLNGVDI